MTRMRFLTLLFSFSTACSSLQIMPEWSWVYKKKFSNIELEQNDSKKEVLFTKNEIPCFTQLMFSWNALRPEKGYFSFFVQVRNAKTKKWGAWHKMFDWGNGIQKSYQDVKQNDISQYTHVRLEMLPGAYADAFKIRVRCSDKVPLSTLKGFAVSTTNFDLFTSERSRKDITHLSSVMVHGVPRYSQFLIEHPRRQGFCSPTSCSMLVSFLLKRSINPLDFAHRTYDQGLDAYGSWPFNMAHAFEHCSSLGWFWTIRCNSFKQIHTQLLRGIPVVVSVRGPLSGAAGLYANGHLLTIVGWDKEKQAVICHDPAFNTNEETLVAYNRDDFLAAWEKSRRLTYYAELNSPKKNVVKKRI